jgi:hypothetical protein
MLDNLYSNDLSNWEQEVIALSFLYNIKLERKNFSSNFYGRYLNLLHVLETLPLTWAASICRSTLKINEQASLPQLETLLNKICN